MPYKGRKNYNKKKSYSKNSKAYVKSIAKQVVLDSAETHRLDYTFQAAAISTSASIWRLTSIGQGTTDADRIGDKIKLTSMLLNCTLKSNNVAGASMSQPVRMLVVRAKLRYNSSELEASDFPGWNQNFDEDMQDLYTVLYDKVYTPTLHRERLYNGADVIVYQDSRSINFQIHPRVSSTVRWDDAKVGANQPAVVGDIYLVGIGSTAALGPLARLDLNLMFKDL